jgi:hypothetical protein
LPCYFLMRIAVTPKCCVFIDASLPELQRYRQLHCLEAGVSKRGIKR